MEIKKTAEIIMDKIEMSLDEIISKTKGPRQQKGKGGGARQRPFFKGGRGAVAGGRVQKRRGGGVGGSPAGGRPRFPRVSV